MFPSLNRQQQQESLTAGLRLAMMGVVALTLVGCGGNGESVLMDLRSAVPTAAPAKPATALTVAVTTFDDSALTDQKRLGSRSHLWGGTSHFDLTGGKTGDVVSQVVAESLKQRGWQVEKGADGKAQATISGKILELSVNAKSSFGSTEITASSKIVVEAVNAADGSKVRMTLSGAGAQTVVWFEPEDAQSLLAETVSESVEKLIANTKVEDKALRLK